MATAETASTGDDGFTMNFTLDVVRSISQDVEDVARQGALGNFRKARTMYEEALEAHRDQFPVYAEHLRLCLDGGDWGSLAEASDYGAGRWSNLASGIVGLLSAFGRAVTNEDKGLSATEANFGEVFECHRQLARIFEHKTNPSDLNHEEMLATAILIHPMYHWTMPRSHKLTWSSNKRLLQIIEYSLRKSNYWVAEVALESYFRGNLDQSSDGSRLDQATMLQVTMLVLDTLGRNFDTQDEEELWARIAISQTLCEGILKNSRRETARFQKNDLSPYIMLRLSDLVAQACSRDESGEWLRSRGSIRQQLIEFDKNLLADPAHTDDAVYSKRNDTLRALHEIADANQDFAMMSSIAERIVLLDQGKSQSKYSLAFRPYQVDAQRPEEIKEATPTKHELNPGGVDEELASPTRKAPNWASMRPTVHDHGFSVVSPPTDGAHLVDIVIIHGLQGHPLKTWLHKTPTGSGTTHKDQHSRRSAIQLFSRKKAITKEAVGEQSPALSTSNFDPVNNTEVYWPTDLLPVQCPQARIMVWGYDIIVTRGLGQAAQNLLYSLSDERTSRKPIIFVAHSLGGILVKELLSYADSSRERECLEIIEDLSAVVFLGTPHRGSGAAGIADIAQRAVSALLVDNSRPIILESLGLRNNDLIHSHQSFARILDERRFEVNTFRESKGMGGLNSDLVVPNESSTLGHLREHLETLDANHLSMSKFKGFGDPNYRKFGDAMSELYKHAVKSSRGESGDQTVRVQRL